MLHNAPAARSAAERPDHDRLPPPEDDQGKNDDGLDGDHRHPANNEGPEDGPGKDDDGLDGDHRRPAPDEGPEDGPGKDDDGEGPDEHGISSRNA